jgi:hypothetical protein
VLPMRLLPSRKVWACRLYNGVTSLPCNRRGRAGTGLGLSTPAAPARSFTTTGCYQPPLSCLSRSWRECMAMAARRSREPGLWICRERRNDGTPSYQVSPEGTDVLQNLIDIRPGVHPADSCDGSLRSSDGATPAAVERARRATHRIDFGENASTTSSRCGRCLDPGLECLRFVLKTWPALIYRWTETHCLSDDTKRPASSLRFQFSADSIIIAFAF